MKAAQVPATVPKSSNALQQKVISGSVAITDHVKTYDSISGPSCNESWRLLLDSEEYEPLKTSN